MPNPTLAHYQDARGVHHDVVVRKHDAAWQVLDVSARTTTVIETLTQEGRPEAEAIAREYAREQQAAHTATAGGRLLTGSRHDPAPRRRWLTTVGQPGEPTAATGTGPVRPFRGARARGR